MVCVVGQKALKLSVVAEDCKDLSLVKLSVVGWRFFPNASPELLSIFIFTDREESDSSS